jgi:hypothetical protein
LEIVTEITSAVEYDLFFNRLGDDQQQKIMSEAFEMLPDFVRDYKPGNEPNYENRATEALLKQNRNILLDRMISPVPPIPAKIKKTLLK